MKVRKIVMMLFVLCFSVAWTFTVNAQTVEEEYTEIEHDFVTKACETEYTLDGKTYKITPSGKIALERKMTTVDLTESDVDMLLSSTVTEDRLSEELANGYIEIIRYGSPDDSSEDSSSAADDTVIGGTTENNQTGKDIWDAVVGDANQNGNSRPNSVFNPNSSSDSKNDSSLSGSSSQEEDSNGSDDSSAEGNPNSNLDSSERGQGTMDLWDMGAYMDSKEKEAETGSEEEDGAEYSGDEKEAEKDSQDKSGDEKDRSSEKVERQVDRVLKKLDQDKKKQNENSVLSNYKMPTEKKAKAQIMFDTDSEEIQILDKDKKNILAYSEADITSKEIEGNVIHIEFLLPLVLVFAFISILCVYFAYKQEFFEDKSKARWKKLIRAVFMLGLGLNLFLILAGIGLFVGFLRGSTVVRALNRSSYYEHAYADMVENTVRILDENNADTNILMNVLTYQDFALTMKQGTEQQLDTSKYDFDASEKQEAVQEQLDAYYKKQETEELEESGVEETKKEKKERKAERKEKVTVITNSIMSNYKKYIEFYPSHIIKEMKRDAKAVFQLVFPAAVLGSLINIVGLVFISRNRRGNILQVGFSVLGVGCIGVLSTLFVYVKKPYADLFITPEYLYEFFLDYVDGGVKTVLIIVALVVVLGAALTFLGMKVRNRSRKD